MAGKNSFSASAIAAAAGGCTMTVCISSILALILGALAIWLAISHFRRFKGRLPPGPIGLPFIGVTSKLGKDPQITISNWAKQYKSNVISMYLGPQLTVVLNDYEAIKAGYIDQTEDYSGRPQAFVTKYLSGGAHGT